MSDSAPLQALAFARYDSRLFFGDVIGTTCLCKTLYTLPLHPRQIAENKSSAVIPFWQVNCPLPYVTSLRCDMVLRQTFNFLDSSGASLLAACH
jgi:hypothetical protein